MRKTKQQIAAEALIRKLRPSVQKAFLEVIRKSRGDIDIGALRIALDAGDIASALAQFRLDAGVMYPLRDAISAAYVAGGMSVARQLPMSVSGMFGFDGAHPRAERWIQRAGADLVTNIEDDAIASARRVILAGAADGTGTNAIARQLVGTMKNGTRVGGVIGLTQPMEQGVARTRVRLASGDPAEMRKYLKLQLRDRQYDDIVKRAIRTAQPIGAGQLETIAQAHAQKSMTRRGRVVARNEVFTAQAAGRMEAYTQLTDKPGVEAVTVRWQHSLSENPREDHVAMNGTVVELGGWFEFPGGVRMQHPHDPAGGAAHSVGCRCVAIYRAVVAKN